MAFSEALSNSKKIKGQPRTKILANLVDLMAKMLYASTKAFLFLAKIFKILPYIGIAAILVDSLQPFWQSFILTTLFEPKKATYEI